MWTFSSVTYIFVANETSVMTIAEIKKGIQAYSHNFYKTATGISENQRRYIPLTNSTKVLCLIQSLDTGIS